MSTEFGDEKTCILFSFGSERGPGFPKDGPGHPGTVVARPLAPLGASPLDAPGSIILEDLESVSTTLFCCSCMDYSFRLLLFSCPCVDLDKHSVFCRFTGTVCTRGTDTFSVLAHSLLPFVSHFDTHFLHLGDSPVLCGSRTKLRYTYACKSQDLKAADLGFHFGPWLCCAIHPLSRLHGALLRKPRNFILLASSNFILLYPGTQHHRVTPPIVRLTLTPLALTSPASLKGK